MRTLGCISASALLTRRAAGLSNAEGLRLEQHLETCAECRFDAAAQRALLRASSATAIAGVADSALRRALAEPALAETPTRRPPRWGWVAAGAAAAAMIGLGLWSADEAPRASRLAASQAGGLVAAEPASLEVAHAHLRVEAGTALRWEGASVVLARGALRVEVDPRPHQPFRVETPRFVIEVTGTVFEVSPERVRVLRGSVRVVAPDGAVLREALRAGQTWVPSAETAAAAPRSGDEPVEVASAAAHLEEPGPAEAGRFGPRDEAPDRGRAAPARRTEARHESAAGGDASPTRRRDEAPPEGAASPAGGAVPAEPSARERFEHAVRTQESDPAGAARMYRALEREGGAWAANALFARGRLALDRGQTAAARQILQAYLHRHPRGVNAEDARMLLRDGR